MNLYLLAGNDGINRIDPLGLILFDKSSSFVLVYFGRWWDPRAYWQNAQSGDSFRTASAYSYHALKAPVDLVNGLYHLPQAVNALWHLTPEQLRCLFKDKYEQFLHASPEEQMEMLAGLTGDAVGAWATGASAANSLKALRAARAAEETIPSSIYRGATQGNPAHVALREGEGAVSFRDSMSNPLPEPGSPPQPVLRPGRNYIEVDTSKLPPGTVVPDGGTVVNGQMMPPGHVSVTATPEQIVNATVGGGKFPK